MCAPEWGAAGVPSTPPPAGKVWYSRHKTGFVWRTGTPSPFVFKWALWLRFWGISREGTGENQPFFTEDELEHGMARLLRGSGFAAHGWHGFRTGGVFGLWEEGLDWEELMLVSSHLLLDSSLLACLSSGLIRPFTLQ